MAHRTARLTQFGRLLLDAIDARVYADELATTVGS